MHINKSQNFTQNKAVLHVLIFFDDQQKTRTTHCLCFWFLWNNTQIQKNKRITIKHLIFHTKNQKIQVFSRVAQDKRKQQEKHRI